MASFNNEEERAAWAFAEALIDKARAMMRQAETALERFTVGQEHNRLRCVRRGIGATDAEIRWSETAVAKKALAENSFHVSQAMMYYGAAAAYYSRAQYLRSRGDAGAPAAATAAPEQRRPGPAPGTTGPG